MSQNVLSLPALPVPFPLAINPHGERVDNASFAWVEEHHMLDREDQLRRLGQARLGLLAARCYPDATPEVLQAIADWNMWLFALDDGYCDESATGAHPAAMARMVAKLLRVVDAPQDGVPAGAGRYASGLRDVRRRLSDHASPTQILRWTAAVHDYLFGIVWEAANRSEDTVPSLGDYVPLRRLSGAIDSCLSLIDISTGHEVSARDWASPSLRTLTRHAANLIGWDNDVFSYRKELADHGAMHNLVTVLSRERSCTIQDAADQVATMHHAEVQAFLDTEAKLPPTLNKAAFDYVSGLKHWIRGFLDYAHHSTRYNQPTPTS